MNIILDIVRGIMIGIANVIPGVSGGTMAVSLGVYDRLISSLTGILKNWKKSVQTLAPILIGGVIGIGGFTFAIEMLLLKVPLATSLTFIGLILGGLPILYSSFQTGLKKKGDHIGARHILCFLLLFALGVGMSLLSGEGTAVNLSSPGAGTILLLFLIGVIASATMVVPGVSGSMVLMILGYYNSIISSVTDFLTALKDWDVAGLAHGFSILFPFGIGVIAGIFLIAKLIEFLFKRFEALTYSAILGLIVSSPFAIFINMGKVSVRPLEVIAGIILFLAGGYLTWRMGDSKEQ